MRGLSASLLAVLLGATVSGCSLFDVSYESKSTSTTEVKDDRALRAEIEALKQRIEALERALQNRR